MANKEEDKKKEYDFKYLDFWIYFGIGLISILLLILFILIIYSLFTSSPVVPIAPAPVPITPAPVPIAPVVPVVPIAPPKQNSIFSFISRSPSPPVPSPSPPVPSPSPPLSSPSPSVSLSPSVSSDKTKSTSFFQSLITPLYNRKINIPSSTTIKKGGSSRIFI